MGFVVVVTQRSLPGVVDVLTFVALLNGVRGTFAYKKLAVDRQYERARIHRPDARTRGQTDWCDPFSAALLGPETGHLRGE